MIKTQNLSKKYGRICALDSLSIEVEAGEILGFLGPNGAGKSTALKILSGYLPQSSGEAQIANISLLSDSLAARAKVGYLPENFVAPNELRVAEYLNYRAGLKGIARKERAAELKRVMQLVGIEDRAKQRFDMLSKGYKQRLGVADCLLGNPPVLILDEPFSGLDPLQRKEFRRILHSLREQKKAIIFSSHVLPEIENLADRILIIHHGKTRVTSDITQLLDSGDRVQLNALGNHQDNAEQLSTLYPDLEIVADNSFTFTVRPALRPECLEKIIAAEIKVSEFSPVRRELDSVFSEFVGSSAEDYP